MLNGGMRIFRGAGLAPYNILYNESEGVLSSGLDGNMQVIAHRESSPTEGYFAVWDSTNKRFNTTS